MKRAHLRHRNGLASGKFGTGICAPVLFLYALCGCLAGPVRAQSQAQIDALRKRLTELPHSSVKVSACFISLPDGQTFCEVHADVPLIPASNHKIITGAAALDILGEAHQFKTTLFADGADLVIAGSGDPGFGDPQLARRSGEEPVSVFSRWASALKAGGIHQVAGDIVIDDTSFDHTWVHPSWEADDLAKWYAAPVGALNFNDNCIEVTLWPTRPRAAVGYEVYPPSNWISIVNACTTGPRKPWVLRKDLKPTFELRGGCQERVTLQSVAISDPGIFTGEVLKKVLQAEGVEVLGEVVRPLSPRQASDSTRRIAVHATPIRDVLYRSLSHSQNLFAETLLKAAGREDASLPGSWENGARAIRQRLQHWQVNLQGLVIADGSGLSRDNRATARQIVQVLRKMYMDTQRGSVFMDCLSRNGSHGTLKKRMKDIDGQVWGKSGYMRGIRALSGYVRAQPRRWYAFSVIFNDIPGGTQPYNDIHDHCCRILTGTD